MEYKKTREISNTVKNSLKEEYPDINFQIELCSNDSFGVKFLIQGVEKSKAVEINSDNLDYSKKYGFTQNIIGMEFEFANGKGTPSKYKITRFKPSNRKYPIIATSPSGSRYKFDPEVVRKKLGGNNLINRSVNLENLLESL